MTPLGLSNINHPYVEAFERSDGLWDYRLVAGNGQIVVSSHQGYTSRTDCERGMATAKELFGIVDLAHDVRWA